MATCSILEHFTKENMICRWCFNQVNSENSDEMQFENAMIFVESFASLMGEKLKKNNSFVMFAPLSLPLWLLLLLLVHMHPFI